MLALIVWYFTWPSADDAATLSFGWVGLVLLRNLALEVSLYEFWHQLLFGALATEGIKAHRYYERDPYARPRALWRERFWTVCGFCWSTAYECLVLRY